MILIQNVMGVKQVARAKKSFVKGTWVICILIILKQKKTNRNARNNPKSRVRRAMNNVVKSNVIMVCQEPIKNKNSASHNLSSSPVRDSNFSHLSN